MKSGQSRNRGPEKGTVLPWWVEILFVQIGLPDKWLRSFLKNKKRLLRYASDNRSNLRYTIIGLFILLYFYPIVRRAKIHNQCINGSIDYIKIKAPQEAGIDKNSLYAWSNRFCNGGDLF